MSYIDAKIDRKKNIIDIVERRNGKRIYVQHRPSYLFYYKDNNGPFRSIFGDNLSKFQTPSYELFIQEKKKQANKRLFESDCDVVFRCLADNYLDESPPVPNIVFFDIEVEFNEKTGFADPTNPTNEITAIGLHFNWLEKTVCLAVKPDTLSQEEADTIADEIGNVLLMKDEDELLDTFLDLIDDADILSGWNSESFDIPYIVNRLIKLRGKSATRRLCLWNMLPSKRTFTRFEKDHSTYDLHGRIHLDYLQVYRKYTYSELQSYSLDNVSRHELNEQKVAYTGTLDQLYKQNFKLFLEYNIQDTDLLKKLEDKLKFLDLSNEICHANTVLLPTTMGAVAQNDQAIINEAHRHNLIVPDKIRKPVVGRAAGAFVYDSDKGIHRWIGSIDINSLYPSIIRSLNMSPECVVGQIRQDITEAEMDCTEDYWSGKFSCREYELVMMQNKLVDLVLEFENGQSTTMTGAEIYDLIYNQGNKWAISSNGTIFSYEKDGIIPMLLSRWYSERQEQQAKAKEFEGVDDKKFKYWDKIQHVRKIMLNSAYGALLNRHSRFFDFRLGQSVTLTGRSISRHMASTINEVLVGEYKEMDGAIIAGDTDSSYFSAYHIFKDDIESGKIEWDKDTVIKFYDEIANIVNDSFTSYMREKHHVPESYGKLIRAAREIVGSKGLFMTKKRYGIMVFDDGGKRKDTDGKPGKLKVTGLDIKRSDTPVYIQNFLEEILEMVLVDKTDDEICDRITEFRNEFRAREPWEKGTPKRCNKLTYYTGEWEKTGKCRVGHVMAAINYNRLRDMHNDHHSMPIFDGMKTIVCKLKSNHLNMTSVAIPIDENRIPDWFQKLPFDNEKMEATILDKKMENVIGLAGIDLSKTNPKTNFDDLFEF